MIDPNSFLNHFYSQVAWMRERRYKKPRLLGLSIAEMERHEPAPFEQDIENFVSFLTGRNVPPMERLKKWCDNNNCVIVKDEYGMSLYIRVHFF